MTRYLLAVAALLLSACSSHQGRPDGAKPAPTASTSFSVVKDVAYTPPDWPARLTSDIYTPTGKGPFPAVVMIHGGGWNGRTRDDMVRYCEMAAARGYVAMNVSYRLAPAARFPAQLHDVQQAVTWLRANADKQKVRPDHIGAWGYSAGAHLAALLAMTGPGDRQFVEGTRVQALVAGGTPVDLRFYPNGDLVNGLMGVSLTKNPEIWRDASPMAMLTAGDPPTFLYHGTFDFTVGVDNARVMYSALNAAGVPSELYLIRGLEHLSTFWVDAPVEEGIDFLDRYLR
ncbi:MAG: alpha/beta hydrolase [Steroidobacteraceae bacterium]